MDYKIICPNCRAKLSRLYYLTTALNYRCRRCGARFRPTAIGLVINFAVCALQVFWFILYLKQVVAPSIALGLVSVTFVLAIWAVPCLTPVKLVEIGKTHAQER